MIVSNSLTINSPFKQSDTTLNSGETHQGKILSKISSTEYLTQLYGKEVVLKSDEDISESARISFKIDSFEEGVKPVLNVSEVKVLSENQSTNSSLTSADNDGIDPSSDLAKALSVLKSKNIAVNSETIVAVSKFIDSPGLLSQKLATVQSMANKDIPITFENLNAVHRALTDNNPISLANTANNLVEVTMDSAAQSKEYMKTIEPALARIDYDTNFKNSDLKTLISDKTVPIDMLKVKANEFFESQRNISSSIKQLYQTAIDKSNTNADVKDVISHYENYQKNISSLQLSSHVNSHISEINEAKNMLIALAKNDFASVKSAVDYIEKELNSSHLSEDLSKNIKASLSTFLSKATTLENLNMPITVVNQSIKEGIHSVINTIETVNFDKSSSEILLTQSDKTEVFYNKLQSIVESAPSVDFIKTALSEAINNLSGIDSIEPNKLLQVLEKAISDFEIKNQNPEIIPEEKTMKELVSDIKKQIPQSRDLSDITKEIKTKILDNSSINKGLDPDVKRNIELDLKKANTLNEAGLKNQALAHIEKVLDTLTMLDTKVSATTSNKIEASTNSIEVNIKNTLNNLSKLLDLNKQFNQTIINVSSKSSVSDAITEEIKNLHIRLESISSLELPSDMSLSKMNEEITISKDKIEALIASTPNNIPSVKTPTQVITDTLTDYAKDLSSSKDLVKLPDISLDGLSSSQIALVKGLQEAFDTASKAFDSGLQLSALKQLQQTLTDTINKLNAADILPSEEAMNSLKDTLSGILNEEKSNTLNSISKGIPEASIDMAVVETLNSIKAGLKYPINFDKLSQVVEHSDLPESIESELKSIIADSKKINAAGNAQRASGKTLNDIQKLIESETNQNSAPKSIEETKSSKNIFEHKEMEALLAPLDIGTKDFLVTTITKRMQDAEKSFNQLKRDISRNLDTVIKLTENTKTNVSQHTQAALEKSITTLDKAILKSDVLLFTDMQTERKLLGMSSQLQIAKNLINKGENVEATKILKAVQKEFDKMSFKPSSTKAMHMVVGEKELLKRQNLTTLIDKQLIYNVNKASIDSPSAKNIFDLISNAGLNYENDVASKILRTDRFSEDLNLENNLKQGILKFLESGPEAAKESLVKVLESVNGQQLLNKSDTNSNHQSLFFNIPFVSGKEINDLKVFVNSRKNGENIDWQNTSLYFLIETSKLGKTGIHVSVAEKYVNFTVKNNHSFVKTIGEKYLPTLKTNLEAVGYNVSNLKFEPFDAEVKDSKPSESKTENVSINNQGVDIKI